jgi:hypothetical protein
VATRLKDGTQLVEFAAREKERIIVDGPVPQNMPHGNPEFFVVQPAPNKRECVCVASLDSANAES